MLYRPRRATNPYRIGILRISPIVGPYLRPIFMDTASSFVVDSHNFRLFQPPACRSIVNGVIEAKTRIVTGIGMPHVIRSISPVITAARNLEHPCKVIIQLRGEVALHRDFRCGAKVLVRGYVPFNPRRFRAYPAIGVQRSRLRASIARFHDTDSAPELILIPLPITSENKRSIPPGFIGKCNLRPPKHQTRHRRRSHDERPPRHAFALSGLRAFSAKAA